MTDFPGVILKVDGLPSSARDMAQRLRVMASVTGPKDMVGFGLAPDSVRHLAQTVEAGAYWSGLRAEGGLLTRAEVERAIAEGAEAARRDMAAEISAEVASRVTRVVRVYRRLNVLALALGASLGIAAAVVVMGAMRVMGAL